jgi:Beta-lactamase enzyme family
MGVDVSLTERQMAEEYYGIQLPAGTPDPRGEFEKAVQREEPAQRAAGARKYSADMRNTATAIGVVELLTKLQLGKILSKQSTALLFEMMTRSPLLPGRLKGLLPPDVVVAHKPGTPDTTGGVTAATNDVGVITLPDKSHLAVAVFIKDSDADVQTRESVIARMAKLVYDCWTSKQFARGSERSGKPRTSPEASTDLARFILGFWGWIAIQQAPIDRSDAFGDDRAASR